MNLSDPKQLTDLHLFRAIKRPKAWTQFIISREFRVQYKRDGQFRVVTVPAGFITDLASVPRVGRWFASKTDGIEASVTHDWLYASHDTTKEEADKLFLLLMEYDGVIGLRRQVMYNAVRVFGGSVYEGRSLDNSMMTM